MISKNGPRFNYFAAYIFSMKKIALFIILFAAVYSLQAQRNYSITWGEAIKLRKGTADLDIIAADNTGLYFSEKRQNRSMFSSNGPSVYKLYKMDKNFGEIFEKEYKKELRGLEFQSFQTMGSDLYMFVTDYDRKTRAFTILGAKIDKSSGDLMGDFRELGRYELENRRDDYDVKVTSIRNGNAFLLVSNISAKDRVSIGVTLLDKNLKEIESAVINMAFDPNLYELADVQYTKDNKIVVLGKKFEETIIKKKRKRLVFTEFEMAVYNSKGALEKNIALNAQDRFVISGKLIEQKSGDLLLAGFYSNGARKEDLDGFFINKIDPVAGTLTVSSFREINSGMLGKAFEDQGDDDDESRESRKQAKKAQDNDDEDEFPNSFVIRSVDTNPVDNSIVITAEISKYSYYSYTSSNYNATTRTWTYNTTHVHRFNNKDVLMIAADQNGNIRWLNALAKSQQEEVRYTSQSSSGWYSYYDRGYYFANAGGMPYYSSYTSLLLNNNLVLIFNDHTSNNVNPEYGDRVKTVYNFRKRSNAYGVAVDLATGKMTRKTIASNNDETILMPRHAYVVNNELYVPSWRQHTLAKTELKFAKIMVR